MLFNTVQTAGSDFTFGTLVLGHLGAANVTVP